MVKRAVMYGAGSIGRGFMGQLFSQSGYEVVFIDINPELIAEINRKRSYPIKIVKNEGSYEIMIKNIRAVNGKDSKKVADEIALAEVMSTAVGVNILPQIAKSIAEGLRTRWREKNFRPLNIIVCENMLKANRYLEELVKAQLTGNEVSYLNDTVGFVETSVARNVPVMTPDMQEGNPLKINAEEYCELPLDRDSIKGEMPQIVNMKLIYPFDFYMKRKLYVHNMAHATASYLGFQEGLKFLWEAWRISAIKLITYHAMVESSIALSLEHDLPLVELLEHLENITYRFSNRMLGITVERLGADPLRKLSENDRLVGPAKLCVKHGIRPVYLCVGIAAAFLYINENDPFAAKVQETISKEGIGSAITKYCSLDPSGIIAETVIEFYNMIKSKVCWEDIIEKAEKIKDDGIITK